MASEETKKDRMPWAFAVGVFVLLFGVVALLAGPGGDARAFIWLGAGLLLVCTGLIQRSIEKLRR